MTPDIRFIDISFAQGQVNWDEIEASIKRGSIDGVIIRAGYGGGGIDDQFETNQSEARRRGIPRAFYFFAYPGRSNGSAQAQEFRDRVGDLQEGEVIALDMEDEPTYGRRLVAGDVAWSVEFLDKSTELFGVRPLLYINTDVKSRFNWQPVVDGNYGLWLANYGTNNGQPQTEPLATPWPFYVLWQYTSRGNVAGISPVDVSILGGDLNMFRAYGYKSPIAPPPVNNPDPAVVNPPAPLPEPTPNPSTVIPPSDTPTSNPNPLPPVEPTPVKPAAKSLEGILAIASNIIAFLTIFFSTLVLPANSPSWLVTIVAILGAVVLNINLAIQRTKLKLQAIKSTAEAQGAK